MTTTNSQHQGYVSSEETGEFSLRTQLFDGEPELVIYLLEDRQLDMIRVVTPDGNTWRVTRD